MENNNPMIEIRDLYKQFSKVAALENINLKVDKGSKVVILGPSGSGKSTLLRCINQLEEQTSGEIWIDGARVTRDPRRLNTMRAEVGMVFQHFNLYPSPDRPGKYHPCTADRTQNTCCPGGRNCAHPAQEGWDRT